MLRIVFLTMHKNHNGIMDEIYEKEKSDFRNNLENSGKEFLKPEVKYFLDYTLFHHNWRDVISDLFEISKTKNVYIVIGGVMSGVAIVKYLRYKLLGVNDKLNLYTVEEKMFMNEKQEDVRLNQYILVKIDDEKNKFDQYPEDEYILKSLFHGVIMSRHDKDELHSLKETLKLFVNSH